VNLPAQALEVFRDLLDLPDDEVASRLRTLDPELASAVRRLLEADRRSSELLDADESRFGDPLLLAPWADPLDEDAAMVGLTIGAYRTIRLVGRGGMGVVFLAERTDGQFEKQVALKLLRQGLASAEVQRRFFRERQILARLDHPNIARLLDGGVSQDGRPYFVMEFVEGQPIDDWCARRAVEAESAVRLVSLCCRAVATAHAQLVVHRDLKPSNILVTEAGELKLLDFGIAKVLEGEGTDPAAGETALTRVGAQLLTPRYAAPEQILGEPLSTATDVYSLGVVLYELLTGLSPHQRTGREWAELAAKVSQEVVARPSAALRRRLSGRGETEGAAPSAATTSSTRIAPHRLEGDLDTILLKALDRDPRRRYASAAALGEDLERFLDGRPVLARADTAGYRLRKFVRRHRTGVAAAAIAAASLVAGLGIALWQARAARAQARRAEAAQSFLQNVFLLSDPDRAKGENLTARDLLDRGAARVDVELARQPELRAEMQGLLGNVYSQLSLYPQAQELLEKSLRERERVLDGDDPLLAASHQRVGLVLHRSARYDEAKRHFEAALAIHQRRGKPWDQAGVLNDLANLARAQGNLDGAQELAEQVVDLRRRFGPPQSPELGKALNNLALVRWRKKEHAAAVPIYEEALAIHRRNEGDPSSLVAGTEDNLAMVFNDLGRLEEAQAHNAKALEILERIYREPHPALGSALNSAGWIATRRGDDEAAIRFYERALAIYAKTQAANHPDVAYPEKNLGRILMNRGDLEPALARYRRALAIRETAYGAVHPEVASSLLDVAAGLRAMGRIGEARVTLERAVEVYRKAVGERHPRTATALLGLGQAFALEGRPADARRAFEECLSIRLEKLDAGDAAIDEARAELAKGGAAH
jgi:serine/threonine protein kinase